MKRILQTAFLALTVLLLLAVPLLTAFSTQDTVSFYEQRMLAVFPSPTPENVLDGSYFTAIETYLKDHIFRRDTLLKLNTATELALDRVSVSGLLVTEEALLDDYGYYWWELDYLIAQAETAAAGYARLAQTVEDYGGRFVYLGVPQYTTYFADKYPEFTDSRLWHTTGIRSAFSTAMSNAGVPFVDLYAAYEAAGFPEDYYFHSDHHYTTEGAFFAVETLLARLQTLDGAAFTPLTAADYNSLRLANPFLGSSNRKLYGLWKSDDHITVMTPTQTIPFTRTDNGNPAESIWNLPATDTTQITYDVYMGGDVAETVIQTNRPELPSILIYGDSFTNPIEALLWANFDETRSLDFRYYTEKTLTEYIAEYQPDYVVCIRDESVILSSAGNGTTK